MADVEWLHELIDKLRGHLDVCIKLPLCTSSTRGGVVSELKDALNYIKKNKGQDIDIAVYIKRNFAPALRESIKYYNDFVHTYSTPKNIKLYGEDFVKPAKDYVAYAGKLWALSQKIIKFTK